MNSHRDDEEASLAMQRLRFLGLFAIIIATTSSLRAEQGVLVVKVSDARARAIARLQMRAEGGSPSAPTDDGGVARLRLDPNTKSGQWILLSLFKPEIEWVFISPWDGRVTVPSFETSTEVPILLAARGDRALLENGTALASITANVLKKIRLEGKDEPVREDQRRSEAMAEVARAYELKPEDLDRAIRAWGEKTDDPYEKGLAGLYTKHYPDASAQLGKSLAVRESELVNAQDKVAEAAFYLGWSLYVQGKYVESVTAYRKVVALRPDDDTALNNLGQALTEAGELAQAEPIYRRALAIREAEFGQSHPLTGMSLNNLAVLLQRKGQYTAAEPLLRRALAISEYAFGPNNPETAKVLKNLGDLLAVEGNYAEGEHLLRRSLAIVERLPGSDEYLIAVVLDSLAQHLEERDDYADAEPMLRRALAIAEKTLGRDHPEIAKLLNNLGNLLKSKHEYVEAESLYRRALDISEKSFGAEHPNTSVILSSLGLLLQAKGDYAAAESMSRRALAITERALGPDSPRQFSRWSTIAFSGVAGQRQLGSVAGRVSSGIHLLKGNRVIG